MDELMLAEKGQAELTEIHKEMVAKNNTTPEN